MSINNDPRLDDGATAVDLASYYYRRARAKLDATTEILGRGCADPEEVARRSADVDAARAEVIERRRRLDIALEAEKQGLQ